MKYRIHANRWTTGPFRIKWINEYTWTATIYVQVQDIWVHLVETAFRKTEDEAVELAREFIKENNTGPSWFHDPESYEEVEAP